MTHPDLTTTGKPCETPGCPVEIPRLPWQRRFCAGCAARRNAASQAASKAHIVRARGATTHRQ